MSSSSNTRQKPRMLTDRERLLLRLDLILYIRLLRQMRRPQAWINSVKPSTTVGQ